MPRTETRPTTGLFQKTKMCKFKRLNLCSRGDACTYAHNETELKPLPNLYKTKMCFEMSKNKECKNPTCPYAHTKTELRNIAYKNAQLEEKRNRQAQDFGKGPHYPPKPIGYVVVPFPAMNAPMLQDMQMFMKPGLMGTNGPLTLNDALQPHQEDSDKGNSCNASFTWEKTDTTAYDSPDELESGDFSEKQYSEPEETPEIAEMPEMLEETPEMPVTWTVKNTFLELSPTSKAEGQSEPRLSRCSSTPGLFFM